MSRVLDGRWRVEDNEVSALLIVFSFSGALLFSLCPGEEDTCTPEVDILRLKSLEVFAILSARRTSPRFCKATERDKAAQTCAKQRLVHIAS